MSLIKCVECGQEYSDKVEACPKCACPTNAQITKGKVEEVKPEVETEAIEEEDQITEKIRPKIGRRIKRAMVGLTIIGLAVIGVSVNSNIQTSQRKGTEVGGEVVEKEINDLEDTIIYPTRSAALKACNKWANNQYKNDQLYFDEKEKNLPLDEYPQYFRWYTYTTCRPKTYLSMNNAIVGIHNRKIISFYRHYEDSPLNSTLHNSWDISIRASGNWSDIPEVKEAEKELNDELGVNNFWKHTYIPYSREHYKPVIASICLRIGKTARTTKAETSAQYYNYNFCRRTLYSDFIESQDGYQKHFHGMSVTNEQGLELFWLYQIFGRVDFNADKIFPYVKP